MLCPKCARPTVLLPLLLGLTLSPASVRADEAGGFHFQTHRGGGIAVPENTLEVFEEAWKIGATPEADLRTTKDGTIVCFHDPDFKRVVGNASEVEGDSIEELKLAEVKKLEVGSFRGAEFQGQRVPTLASVFEKMRERPERLIYLDIKKADLDQLAALVREYDVESQVIFTTTHHDLIKDWKQRVPDSLTLLWNGGSEEQLKKKLREVRKDDFEGITHLQIHVKVGDIDSEEPFMPSSEFLKQVRDELKSRGIVFQVLPWKCSDKEAYVRLLELGVESFATDYPEVTLEAVEEF